MHMKNILALSIQGGSLMVVDKRFLTLGYSMEGYPFNCFKSLRTLRAVEESLDRSLANDAWF